MKYLIAGDLHIGNNKNNPAFFKTSLQYADWIKNICLEKSINTIIQLGDVFHNREMVHVPTINCAHDFFEKLSDYQIHIVVGNHDALYNNTSDVNSLKLLKNWPNITLHEKVGVLDNMCFCGWGTKLEDIPDTSDVVFGHFDIKGFEMNAYKISEHGFTASNLMEKCKMLFSGHYHKPQMRFYDKKPLIYSGSAYQLNWGESGEKKYVYILDSESLQFEMIENTISPKFVKIKDASQTDEIKNNFVSIEIDKVEDLPKIETQLKNAKCLDFITVLKKQQSVKSELTESTEIQDSFEGCSVYECIDEYVSTLLISEQDKQIILKSLKDTYDKCI
jgi:DNA repair exonuclease SbcCD nuclease subunit